MMRCSPRWLAVPTTAIAIAIPGAAHAKDPATSQALFDQGRKLMAQERWTERLRQARIARRSRKIASKRSHCGCLECACAWLPRTVDPGSHLLSATASGRKTWSLRIDVPARAQEVVVDVPELEIDPQAEPAGMKTLPLTQRSLPRPLRSRQRERDSARPASS